MTRRLLAGAVVAAVAALVVACSSSTGTQPSTPSATSTQATTASATVDTFTGVWGLTGTDTTPILPDNTAVALLANGVCSAVEFKVDRKADGRSATVTFAATCANARVRGTGEGQLSGDVLNWSASGTVSVGTTSARTCAFNFPAGSNTATPAGAGQVKVSYSGKVCDLPVSGTQVLTKR
jgi:hypothetical protein